jgi:hypothetical protein
MTDIEYLHKSGIDNGRIARRYRKILEAVHKFINMKGVAQSIVVDGKILKTAVYDYFVDIARIKEFHNIDKVNFEKIYGYTAYWLLRRKPIQVVKPFPGSEFINELLVAAYTISNILTEKRIDGNKCAKNATFNKFQLLLLYNLKYRPITQQSLELMVEAFFCGCDFVGDGDKGKT